MNIFFVMVWCMASTVYGMRCMTEEGAGLTVSIRQPPALVDQCASCIMRHIGTGDMRYKKDNVFVYKESPYRVNHETLNVLIGYGVHHCYTQPHLKHIEHITPDHAYGYCQKPIEEGYNLYRLSLKTNEERVVPFTHETLLDIATAFACSPGGGRVLINRGTRAQFIDIEGTYTRNITCPNSKVIVDMCFVGDDYIVVQSAHAFIAKKVVSKGRLIGVGRRKQRRLSSLGPAIHRSYQLLIKDALRSGKGLVYSLINVADMSLVGAWRVNGVPICLRYKGAETVDEQHNRIAFQTSIMTLQISDISAMQLTANKELPAIANIKHPGNIAAVAFANSARWVLTAGSAADTCICVWDVQSSSCCIQIPYCGTPIKMISSAGNDCLIGNTRGALSYLDIRQINALVRMRKYLHEQTTQHE